MELLKERTQYINTHKLSYIAAILLVDGWDQVYQSCVLLSGLESVRLCCRVGVGRDTSDHVLVLLVGGKVLSAVE